VTDEQQPTPDAAPEPGGEAAGEAVATRMSIEPIEIEEELQRSYLDYAMSVIVGRALPDVRDGLKPVHRRILFSMFEGGMRAGSQHRKSAAAVGDVMKKYHPHGDSSIYDALVRMGQPWAIRYPLIDGHGNFGSVDGDPPAAMRYTEARLSPLAMELLRDIDEETVDFIDNYDGQEEEPVVLPARFPNLLVNGSSGIAVGMATNVPPHNLDEITDAVVATIANPDITFDELWELVPGPDFPTGAFIMGTDGIRSAYETGRGSIRMRAVCDVEEDDRGGERIVVTELPYQVNKANLAMKIAELVNDKRIAGIRDVRDESNRQGMRLVVELKRDANAQVILNQLYKMTQLQDTFGVINLSLVDNVPRTLSLKDTIVNYIAHQVEVIERRTRYRLRKAEERAHVLEGLIVALDNLDEVIALIRSAPSADAALGELQSRFDLSEIQARAILDMQLRRLAALERQRILDEYAELQAIITDLRDILDRPERVRAIIVEELTELRDRFGDARRTKIIPGGGDLEMEDLIAEEDVVVTLTRAGYVKRVKVSEYRTQKRGGRGVSGAGLKEDDIVRDMFVTTTHHWLLFFTNLGRVYRIKAWQIPEKSRTARGTYVANVEGLAMEKGETVAAVVDLKSFEHPDGEPRYLLFATQQGMVKRTALVEYDSPRSVLIAINLRDGDELIGVTVTSGQDEVLLVSRRAQSIRFPETDARPMGRDTTGVLGMRLAAGDSVLSMTLAVPDGQLLVVTDEGYGKRTPLERYPLQKRGGKGVKTAMLTEARGGLVGALVAAYEQEIFLVTDTGVIIRMDVKDIRPTGRSTQGVRVMKPGQGAKVASVAPVVGDDLDEDPTPLSGLDDDVDAEADAAELSAASAAEGDGDVEILAADEVRDEAPADGADEVE
jgi:DNA gyrase subunit A